MDSYEAVEGSRADLGGVFADDRPAGSDARVQRDAIARGCAHLGAAVGGAVSVTTKTTHEAYGIPTPEANAEGLRTTRMAVYLARHIRLDDLPEFKDEVDLIRRETKPILDKVLEMGDGSPFVLSH